MVVEPTAVEAKVSNRRVPYCMRVFIAFSE
jgi:hypothetical protein